jgi:hypothetical protein
VHLEDVDRALRLVLGLSVAAATVACVAVLIAGFDLTLGLSAAALALLAVGYRGLRRHRAPVPPLGAGARRRGARAFALRPRAAAPGALNTARIDDSAE